MTAEKIRFLNAMHGILKANARGRACAMVRAELERRLLHMGYCLTDRKYREGYAALPICSCEDGLYVPIHPSDLAEVERYWWPKMSRELREAKMERLRIEYPELAEELRRQPGLFDRPQYSTMGEARP